MWSRVGMMGLFGFFISLARNSLLLFWRPLLALLIVTDLRLEHNMDVELLLITLKIDSLLSQNKKVG
jgi:hypothetical protein